MKVVHLSVMRQAFPGIRAQLRAEVEAAAELGVDHWETVLLHDGEVMAPWERRVPWLFRRLLLRNIYGWAVALREARSADWLVMRHVPFDLAALVGAMLIPNRVSMHHAKELQELPLIAPGWRGRLAMGVERYTGKFAIARARAVAGVTREIAEYEVERSGHHEPVFVFPNALAAGAVAPIDDFRKSGQVDAAFICSRFSPWHGLDRLIEAVDGPGAEASRCRVVIYLIGEMSDEQRRAVEATPLRRQVFRVLGVMSPSDYQQQILSKCHVAIGSLAMDRQNLRQGSTLKVREMLLCGLPVYSGHEDAALASDFPFYRCESPISIRGLVQFADEMRAYSRDEVARRSEEPLSKLNAMRRFIEGLKSLGPN